MAPQLGPNATSIDASHILCACLELNCAQTTIEYGGKLHHGRIFNRKNYPKHLQQVLKNSSPAGFTSTSSNPAPSHFPMSQPSSSAQLSTSSNPAPPALPSPMTQMNSTQLQTGSPGGVRKSDCLPNSWISTDFPLYPHPSCPSLLSFLPLPANQLFSPSSHPLVLLCPYLAEKEDEMIHMMIPAINIQPLDVLK